MEDARYHEQVPGPLLPGRGNALVLMFEARDGKLTLVELDDGRMIRAFNSAYGRDLGEEWEHTTFNCSPVVDGEPTEFVQTSDIVRVIDPATDEILYQRTQS
ncbi:MAG: hypothetical protein HYU62_05015 [Caulobacterales bacterium]|nr:hypothetical protein [Caulobacterales bacterium]